MLIPPGSKLEMAMLAIETQQKLDACVGIQHTNIITREPRNGHACRGDTIRASLVFQYLACQCCETLSPKQRCLPSKPNLGLVYIPASITLIPLFPKLETTFLAIEAQLQKRSDRDAEYAGI